MVKLITGRRGSGKTKKLIEAIRAAKAQSEGNVVAIQIGSSLRAHIKHDVRLINIEDYNIGGCYSMHGFIAGIMASDYDCTHIFIDGILRIIKEDRDDTEKVSSMLEKINEVSGDIEVTITFSADVSEIPENIKKYL